MAIVTVGDGFFLDMTFLDISALRSGTTTQATSSRMTLKFNDQVSDVFIGSFSYRNGVLSGGNLSGMGEYIGGKLAFEIYDFSMPVQTFNNYIRSGDTFGALSAMLRGGDDINGGAFADALAGFAGDDWIRGWAGNDVLFGGDGNDIILGDDGNDDLLGEGGDDILWGGEGSEAIDGGAGNDRLYGQEDNDWLYGGPGNDLLNGGSGADWFAFEEGNGFDDVEDFNSAQGDRINLHKGEHYVLSEREGSTVITLESGDQITLIGVPNSALGTWLVET
jgi:hypothetical protein